MHVFLVVLLALQPATVIAVLQDNSDTFLAVRIGNVIYTVEFPSSVFKPDKVSDGDRVQAEVQDGKMKVRYKGGKTVEGRVTWVQRTLSPTKALT